MKVYHVSERKITGKMIPRIPKSDYEEQKTPRICFAKNIQGALIGAYEDKDITGKTLYVYSTTHKFYEPTKEEVADVNITGEVWILEPIIPEFEYIIKIEGLEKTIKKTINKQEFDIPVWNYKKEKENMAINMFKKDDKVKVVKGIKAFEGLSGTVLDTNGNQVKVKLNLSNDSELQKNLINVFEAYQLELESLDLLKEDTVSFDNDIEDEKSVNREDLKLTESHNNVYNRHLTKDDLMTPRDDKEKKNVEVGLERWNQILSWLDKNNIKYEHYCPNSDITDVAGIDINGKNFFWLYIDGALEVGVGNNKGYYTADKSFDLNAIMNSVKDYLTNNKNESLKLTEAELKAWCSDNDANYYTQDIKDDKVIIRGLNEDLGEYNFKTKELKVFDYSGTTIDENALEENEDDNNYIRDYVYDIDMIDEKTEIPSWEFASVIATAEDTTEDAVITEAHDRGFKVYLITASEYEKLVVASEKITEQDIMDDFASYLEGNPKVTEVI